MVARCLAIIVLLTVAAQAHAQRIDSVHIFRTLPEQRYNSASAATMAWRLQQRHAPFAAITGESIDRMNDALAERPALGHQTQELPSLAHLGLIYMRGGIHVVGIMRDLDVMVDFTSRREVHIDDWSDRLQIRTLLLGLGL